MAFGLAATVLDLREVVHQHREGRTDLVAVAILVTLLHLAAAAIAAVLAARSQPQASQPEHSEPAATQFDLRRIGANLAQATRSLPQPPRCWDELSLRAGRT